MKTGFDFLTTVAMNHFETEQHFGNLETFIESSSQCPMLLPNLVKFGSLVSENYGLQNLPRKRAWEIC